MRILLTLLFTLLITVASYCQKTIDPETITHITVVVDKSGGIPNLGGTEIESCHTGVQEYGYNVEIYGAYSQAESCQDIYLMLHDGNHTTLGTPYEIVPLEFSDTKVVTPEGLMAYVALVSGTIELNPPSCSENKSGNNDFETYAIVLTIVYETPSGTFEIYVPTEDCDHFPVSGFNNHSVSSSSVDMCCPFNQGFDFGFQSKENTSDNALSNSSNGAKLKVITNPFHEILKIEMDNVELQNAQLLIIDNFGRQESINITGSTISVPMSKKKPGFYTVILKVGDNIQSQRVLKL